MRVGLLLLRMQLYLHSKAHLVLLNKQSASGRSRGLHRRSRSVSQGCLRLLGLLLELRLLLEDPSRFGGRTWVSCRHLGPRLKKGL